MEATAARPGSNSGWLLEWAILECRICIVDSCCPLSELVTFHKVTQNVQDGRTTKTNGFTFELKREQLNLIWLDSVH